MPLNSDDILMACTTNYTESEATCKVCGYSDNIYYDPWNHTLTDCLKQTKENIDNAKANIPNSPA